MAYCLRSLVQILEQVMNPDQHYKKWVLDHAKIPQIQSLLENATFLRDFFDTTSPLILHSMESLEDQIMEAAGKAEDALESHITYQILSNPEGQDIMISPPDLREVLRVFEAVKEEMIKVKAAGQEWGNAPGPVPSTQYPDTKSSKNFETSSKNSKRSSRKSKSSKNSKRSSKNSKSFMNMVVGVAEDLNQLRSQLIGRATELSIIPIVGMGGSGKTTLARILYDEHSSSRSHFDRCAWVTVSQTYDPKKILQTLLVDLVGKPQEENDDLIVTLHKTLFGRRYLIVLDDIWSCQAWDDFQRAFPQNNNRSRIILTTRINTVANYVNSNSHQMQFLSDDDSWKLLNGNVFGEQSCPHELEEVGKIIASNCGGLPLALQVISGVLSQSNKSKDYWEHVAYNVGTTIAKKEDQFSGIFSWSFANLPHYLKPCFLYMGAFPEDHVIQASTIRRLWIAEGFLYPLPNKSLEESAEIHLNALVDRNLIFVHERKINKKAKSYGVHDLLRDLCLRKAQEKKFIHFKDSETDIILEDKLCLRRVIVQLSDDDDKDEYGTLKLTPVARSFVLTGYHESDRFVSRLCFKSSLLRVLDVYSSSISEFHEVFLQLVNLRYLSLWNAKCVIPGRISALRNLQTLLVCSLESIMILEELPYLRHLKFDHLEQICYERSFSVHENLQTLSFLPVETLPKLMGKLPELKKLGITGTQPNENVDFTCFQKLETLHHKNKRYGPNELYKRYKTIFSQSIQTLSLTSRSITQTLLDAIGVLPNLQILKLNGIRFVDSDWEPLEGGYLQLQYLSIKSTNLLHWLATEVHFPVLQHLIIASCEDLTEIPIDIGGIETLQIIEVDKCHSCVFESARRIWDEQIQSGGDTLLQLRLGYSIYGDNEGDEEELKGMVKNDELELYDYTFKSTTILPRSVKSLRLDCCTLIQKSLHTIGCLPQLEYLELYFCHFESSTWEPSKGEFRRLQCLKIRCPRLQNWLATEVHFPVLRRLALTQCRGLDEIPSRLGGIKTLERLELFDCYHNLNDSATRMHDEQRRLGNTLLRTTTDRLYD